MLGESKVGTGWTFGRLGRRGYDTTFDIWSLEETG